MSRLSIEVRNTGSKPIIVCWDASEVKTKGGSYRAIGGGDNECAPNDSVSVIDVATFAADASRRYRIVTKEGDNSYTTTYPSEGGWTTDPTPVISIAR